MAEKTTGDIAEPHYRTSTGEVRCERHATGAEVERLTARAKWALMRDLDSAVVCDCCRHED